eukprot:3786449-Rhodomonas_salina.1
MDRKAKTSVHEKYTSDQDQMQVGYPIDAPVNFRAKVLVVGDTGVGKTCLMLRFTENIFTTSFISTIGIDFKSKICDVDGERMKVQIWDTAGQERFRNITLNYYRGAQGVLLVYDVTDEKSFQNVRSWVTQIRQHAPQGIKVMLIGNKCDKLDHKVIETARGQALADEFGMPFLETSANQNINVINAFTDLAVAIKNRMEKEADRIPTAVVVKRKKGSAESSRCAC